MADFDPPFGQGGERRLPTTTEREQGFGCGPADRTLFNGLFYRIEAELGEVISHAGIAPTDDRNTLLREAIEALIDAATGGGGADFLLMSQARTRLPIFPEVLTDDARIPVTSPAAGTVRLPGGITFQHRGIFRATTAQTDFPTDPSKTYHLRWTPADGFTLKDLASLVYNPTAAAETNPAFDSRFDDMLVARVITNSSNVPTITPLANSNTIKFQYYRPAMVYPAGGAFPPEATEIIDYNFARTPWFFMNGFSESGVNVVPTSVTDGSESNIITTAITRYRASVLTFSWSHIYGIGGRPEYRAAFIAHAN